MAGAGNRQVGEAQLGEKPALVRLQAEAQISAALKVSEHSR
jgi:hypothetical protein